MLCSIVLILEKEQGDVEREDQEGGMYSLLMLFSARCRDIKPESGLGFYLSDLEVYATYRCCKSR